MLNPKSQILNPNEIQNPQIQNPKHYDLEERTFEFSRKIINYTKQLPKTMPNLEVAKQLIRSAGSVGANYIEANEALGKKDFLMRIKICRKEAKESRYWVGLTDPGDGILTEKQAIGQEALELTRIFGAILEKSR